MGIEKGEDIGYLSEGPVFLVTPLCHRWTRVTKSRHRQSFTISAKNYSGRASELGCIVNLFDKRPSSLSRSGRPPLSTFDDLYAVTKFSKVRRLGKSAGGKYSFCRYLNFRTKTMCGTGRKKPQCQKQINPFIPSYRTRTCNRQINRQALGHCKNRR